MRYRNKNRERTGNLTVTGYDGRAVANCVLDLCDSLGVAVSNLSLQKIVYFCHVWSLISLHRPLVRHSFEAWEFGPVLPYLYREFRKFDRGAISERALEIDTITGNFRKVEYAFDQETELLVRQITKFYSRIRASDLVELSHADGGPWHKVWNHGGSVNPGMKISNADVVDFYSKVVRPFSIQ